MFGPLGHADVIAPVTHGLDWVSGLKQAVTCEWRKENVIEKSRWSSASSLAGLESTTQRMPDFLQRRLLMFSQPLSDPPFFQPCWSYFYAVSVTRWLECFGGVTCPKNCLRLLS